MKNGYSISFENGIYSTFHSSNFPVLKEFIDEQNIKEVFKVFKAEASVTWMAEIEKQLHVLVKDYVAPNEQFNEKFEDRVIEKILGHKLTLNPAKKNHSQLIQLNGILNCLNLCNQNGENFYLVCRDNIVSEEQLEIIFRIKYKTKDSPVSLNELYHFLRNLNIRDINNIFGITIELLVKNNLIYISNKEWINATSLFKYFN